MRKPDTYEVVDESMLYAADEKTNESFAVPYTLWRSIRYPKHYVMVLAAAVGSIFREEFRDLSLNEFCSTQGFDTEARKDFNQRFDSVFFKVKFLGR